MFHVRLGSGLLQKIEIKSYISILSCLGPAIFHKTTAFFLLEDAGTTCNTSFQLFSHMNSASHCHLPKDQNLQQWCGNLKPHTDVFHCFLSPYVHDSVYSYQYKQQNELQWSWSLVQECHNSFRWHSILFLHNMQQMVLKGGSNGQYIMLWLENSFIECFNSTWAWEFGSVRIRKHISPIGFVRFRGNDKHIYDGQLRYFSEYSDWAMGWMIWGLMPGTPGTPAMSGVDTATCLVGPRVKWLAFKADCWS